jgi:hypothetical protein
LTRKPHFNKIFIQGDVVAASSSVRRRLFGRSHDSAASAGNASSRNSKDGVSPGPSPQALPGDPPSTASSLGSRHKTKRSLDSKSGDRISIFGNAFGGGLGKGRKPPPRYVPCLSDTVLVLTLSLVRKVWLRASQAPCSAVSTPVVAARVPQADRPPLLLPLPKPALWT